MANKHYHNILDVTVRDAIYPVTTNILWKIFIPVAKVTRIVIHNQASTNSMVVNASVEFETVGCATKALNLLNGANIYDNCCILDINFADPNIEKLSVESNSDFTWDYTKALLPSPSTGIKRQHDEDSPDFKRTCSSNQQQTIPSNNNYFYDSVAYGSDFNQPDYGILENSYGITLRPDRFASSVAHLEAAPYDLWDKFGNFIERRVVIVYGLHFCMTPLKVHNLFSIYGHVLRVKYLSKVPGTALIEMAKPDDAMRVIENLNGQILFDIELIVRLSNQKEVRIGNMFGSSARILQNGAPMFEDFSTNPAPRFMNNKGFTAPSCLLEVSNFPESLTKTTKLLDFLKARQTPKPIELEVFLDSPPDSYSCHLKFQKISEALEAAIALNNCNVMGQRILGVTFVEMND